jgi:RecA/RadA recombinase
MELSITERMRAVYASQQREIDKTLHISSASLTLRERLSTGSLVLDVISGGGLLPGLVQLSGPEQSAKSTACMHVTKSAIEHNIPINELWDAEGSTEPRYAEGILRRKLTQVFDGVGGPKLASYYSETVMETFFDHTAELLRRMPRKVWIEEAGTWAYLFPKRDDKFKALMNGFGLKPDKKLTDENAFICPTEYGGLEAVITADSWPAFVPEVIDEEDASKAMAIMARAFSTHLPRVVGKLRARGVVIVGVNQVRTNPQVRYGSPLYEPGGDALRFYSNMRHRFMAVVPPDGWQRDKDSAQGIEPSVLKDGDTDLYAYKKITNTKNKNGTPFLKGMIRIWTRDHERRGRGIDPVFDVWEYMRLTGQITGTRNNKKGFTVHAEILESVQLTWAQFKLLVLADALNSKELAKRACSEIGIKRPVRLLRRGFSQIADGTAMRLLNGGGAGGVVEDASEDDDVEEI